MKRYQQVLAIAVIVFTSVSSFAGYDEFSCVTNPNLQNANLQCISCGLTKYYADKGIEVNPSHKWLALLAIRARERGFGPSSGSVAKSDQTRERLQKSVIIDLQAYGFCNEYLGKTTVANGRSRNYHDVSAEEWKVFFEFINRDKIPNEKNYANLAEKLGFKDPGFLAKGSAKGNLDYLFEGAYEGYSLDDKRKLFKDKLNEGLAPDYNVSGERAEKAREFIASGEKDEGLRNCLKDIKQRYFQEQMSDRDTYKMCETVAQACDIARVPMDPNQDFCIHKGMGLRPVGSAPAMPGPIPPKPRSTVPNQKSGVK